LALRKRLNASYTSAAVQGFVLEDFAFAGFSLEGLGLAGRFAARAGPGLATAFLIAFAAGSLDLAPRPRVIFAMILIY
jgi:hypothetical protein